MIYWLIYPLLEALVQALLFKYVKGFDPHKEPMYLRIIRGAAFFTWAIWLQYHTGFDYHVDNTLLYSIKTITFSMCSFWIVFDYTLNMLRGKEWHHKGENSGWLDALPPHKYWALKSVALLLALVSLFIEPNTIF